MKNLALISVCFVALLLFQFCKKDNNSDIITTPDDGVHPDVNVDFSCDPVGDGIAYEVGPGKTYERIIDVPFEDLKPGDVVKIYAKSEPYYERIIISNAKGTADAPICICGVPDSEGNRPILDGTNAAVRPVDVNDYYNEIVAYLGMIVIANNWDNHPEYIKIKSLTLQGANQYESNGSQQYKIMGTEQLAPYSTGACGIWMRGSNIEVINCLIQENGNGIFGAYNSPEDPLINVRLYNNIIRNNGTRNIYLQHNVYIEADSLIAVGNQIGPVREGALGANYKSRGAADVIMYNKLIGPAARHFDLVESQNGYDWLSKKESFRQTYVVGNIVVGAEGGAGNILHYGGDGDNNVPSDDLRQGTVYAYNNTFLLKGYYLSGDPQSAYRLSFMDLNTCNEKLYAFNNIFAYQNSGPTEAENTLISVFRTHGSVSHFSNNLLSDATWAWYNDKTDGDPCSNGLQFSVIESSKATVQNLSFVDINSDNFKLNSSSFAIDAGMDIPAGMITVKFQFKAPNLIEARPVNGTIDIGAYEYP